MIKERKRLAALLMETSDWPIYNATDRMLIQVLLLFFHFSSTYAVYLFAIRNRESKKNLDVAAHDLIRSC